MQRCTARTTFPLGSGWLCLFVSCVLTGCGTPTMQVEGTITLDGEPLPGVQVLFDRPEDGSAPSFAGRTDPSGHFVLRNIGGEIKSDASGTYRVSLTTAVATRDATEHTPLPKERIPQHYLDGSLTFDLPPSGTTEAHFELTSRK